MMSKYQTDIRTSSYDAASARPAGYQGTIYEVLAQLYAEPDTHAYRVSARAELLSFLRVSQLPSTGPSVELDEGTRYGDDA